MLHVQANIDKQHWVELTEGVDYREDYLEMKPPENQEVPEMPQIPDLSFLKEVLIGVARSS